MKGGYLKNFSKNYVLSYLTLTFSKLFLSPQLFIRIKGKTLSSFVVTKLLTGSVCIYTGHILYYLNKCVKKTNKKKPLRMSLFV